MRTWPFVLSLGSLMLASPAATWAFPPVDPPWQPFACGNGPMVDAVADHAGAPDERDVVGNGGAPAGYRGVDADYLYVRLRVDKIPTQGARLRAFAWGFAFNTGGPAGSYQILITLDGTSETVGLYRNLNASSAEGPGGPADAPPVATYPFATHGRVLSTPSDFGGDADHFVDMAIPWSDLGPRGLGQDTPIVVWAASSSTGDRLDGDFACHDGRGGGGAGELAGAGSTRSTASGRAPGGGGGAGGGAAGGGLSLEGGPSCGYTGRPPRGSALLAVLFLALLGATRRRGGFSRGT
jgi:hypothetical protein